LDVARSGSAFFARATSTISLITRLHGFQKDFGGVPGRTPFTNIPLEDYIIDTLHLVLRVVPLLFRRSVQAHVNAKVLDKATQWLYDKCAIIINDKVALQTNIGTKKLSMTAVAWPGNVCK
jgi:hypothetical protein